MTPNILAVDVGTTVLKTAVFDPALQKRSETSRRYEVNVYGSCKADVAPDIWWHALKECCAEISEDLRNVGVLVLSVTTPGLVAMEADGTALGPAILFFDGRSTDQARAIRVQVGEENLLRETCNLPVSGGSSLASILWIRENQPNIWSAADKFGHTNTYLCKRLTGNWAIDPSTVSITGLYNTASNNLTWNERVLAAAEIPEQKMPPLFHSHKAVGKLLPAVAAELGLGPDCVVLCGGNDAVLAALSAAMVEPGNAANICGTCDIMCVCLDQPLRSPTFNIRCHVVPNRWLSFFVLNTGGKALEWFQRNFCSEMTEKKFYEEYVPSVLEDLVSKLNVERADSELPDCSPYLAGTRYSLKRHTAGFSGLTLGTTREHMLLALIRSNALEQECHLREISRHIKINRSIAASGGVAAIGGMLKAKERWMTPYEFRYQEQSSLLGAAMLGQFYFRDSMNN